MPESRVPDHDAVGAHVPPSSPSVQEIFNVEHVDRIVRMAALAFDAPMALFALADADCWRPVSRFGLTPSQASWLAAACRAMTGDDPMIANAPPTAPRPGAIAMPEDDPAIGFCASMPVRDADGTRIGVLMLLDTRARDADASNLAVLADGARMLERELAASRLERTMAACGAKEAATRALLDFLPEGVLMLSADGVIVSCNMAAERMYGAGTNGLIGRHAGELTGEDPARLREALGAGAREQLQALARRIDGSVFSAEFSVKLLDGPDARRYALAVRDITMRKEEERMAREADAHRRQYFVNATHELRTPMSSVLGFSELLLKHDFDRDEQRDLLDIVHRQASRLLLLINAMLDMARMDAAGADALDLHRHDACEILGQTLSGLAGIDTPGRIRWSAAPDLPRLLADAARLQQALANVIGNAVRYSPPSSEIRLEIFAAQHDDGPAVGFRVVDQGIGMTAEECAQVFEPFYRARGESNPVGTGLGMTIVRKIVELHGGIARIASTPGAGTEVVLLLPAAPGPD